jgi:hypothetical protein
MTLGFVLLCHTALDRAAEAARFYARAGCPVVVHIDAKVDDQAAAKMMSDLSGFASIRFSTRYPCEWGSWSIVQATQSASELMLAEFPDVRHIYLASGSCLPLRPVEELRSYLDAHPRTDFIESVNAADGGWAIGGFDLERFTLRFPFSWRTNRALFDGYVKLQRKLGIRRKIPDGMIPHLGSQWWCLTRQTLSAILQGADREAHDRYFRHVWIPDESYFQSLVRRVSSNVESRSLTLSKFDFQGRPHIFYDDHHELLRRSGAFLARKIWPQADKLYSTFLAPRAVEAPPEANPGKIDKLFAKAAERRTKGRAGLYMQSRFPAQHRDGNRCAAPYSVFEGFSDLFENFEEWLAKTIDIKVHGHLFAQNKVEFAGRETVFRGGLSDSAELRDYNPRSFLASLIWNTKGEHQSFQFGPDDAQDIASFIAGDPNAHISLISGAFSVPLFHSNRDFGELCAEVTRLQKTEAALIEILRRPETKARVRIWTLAEFIENPMAPLQTIVSDIAPRATRQLTEVPRMVNLDGFDQFLQNLRNQGIKPVLMGDFIAKGGELSVEEPRSRPYVVR